MYSIKGFLVGSFNISSISCCIVTAKKKLVTIEGINLYKTKVQQTQATYLPKKKTSQG